MTAATRFARISLLPPAHRFRLLTSQPSRLRHRSMSSKPANPLNRPAPPSLPREAQREFEDLIRKAQAPLSQPSSNRALAEADLAMHPDARKPVEAEFEGEVNPQTGETGGPKREPVKKWVEGDGDWSFKGRVSDF